MIREERVAIQISGAYTQRLTNAGLTKHAVQYQAAQDEADDDDGPEGTGDNSLEDIAQDEREIPRERLREQLGREPTGEEIDEWLRQQTEGY